jgi:hypothetical protein
MAISFPRAGSQHEGYSICHRIGSACHAGFAIAGRLLRWVRSDRNRPSARQKRSLSYEKQTLGSIGLTSRVCTDDVG